MRNLLKWKIAVPANGALNLGWGIFTYIGFLTMAGWINGTIGFFVYLVLCEVINFIDELNRKELL